MPSTAVNNNKGKKSSKGEEGSNSRSQVKLRHKKDHDTYLKAPHSRHRPKVGDMWNRLTGNAKSCNFFMKGSFDVPLIIDFLSLESIALPDDWDSKRAADRAAKGIETIAQFAGSVDVVVEKVTVDDMNKLIAANYIDFEFGDENGEFSTPIGQIPLSRLLEYQPNLVHSNQGVLYSLSALQCPSSSPWHMPFVRVFSNHSYEANRVLHVRFYVYYTRLLFEMIADSEIKNLTDCLQRDLLEVIPVKRRPKQPVLFTSAADHQQSADYQFSLAGLMRRIESKGYRLADEQPESLSVQLYEFQRSTYQWLLDQERDPHGINSSFWEEWKYGHNSSLFYFPLAGEFRLTRPPKTNGGLLCEEMGLGKTVEIIALILGNPLLADEDADSFNPNNLPVGKTTLIVVPPTLLGQWFDEFRTKVKHIDTEYSCFKVARLDGYHTNALRSVPSCCVRRSAVDRPDPSIWGYEYDGSPISPRKGDQLDVKLDYALGDVFLTGEFRGTQGHDNFHMKFSNIVEELCDFDVILTSYDSLRKDISQYRKLHWHRIVLDECQEIKQSTSAIATGCAGLSSSYRWMVSGTPLCTKIEDLHGELNFLKIWPFSLSDSKDGFWSAKIGKPYANGMESGLRLLHTLMDTVMMRHSKTQRYVETNKRLVAMPDRSIEWKGFSAASDNTEAYVIAYVQKFAADAFCHFIRYGVARGYHGQGINYGQLRHFVAWISMSLTNAADIPLAKLDYFQRAMSPVVRIHNFGASGSCDSEADIMVMSAQNALRHLQSQKRGNNQGFVQESHRTLANVGLVEKENELREEFDAMSIRQLRDMLIENRLPIPCNWQTLPILVDVKHQSTVVTCYKKPNETVADADGLSSFISVGDELKIKCSNEHEALLVQEVIEELNTGSFGHVKIDSRWILDSIKKAEITKKLEAARKKPYVDLLVTMKLQSKTISTGTEMLHEQGFSTLYKIMAGSDVECPICMMPLTQPTFTPCVHAYCRPCVEGLINSNRFNAKCAVCRAKIGFKSLVEVDNSLDSDEDEEREDLGQSNKRIKICEDLSVVQRSSSMGSSSTTEGNLGDVSFIPVDQGTVFTIPEFDGQSTAPTQQHVDAHQHRVVPSYYSNDRSAAFPSLPPSFLLAHSRLANRSPSHTTASYHSSTPYFFSSRFRAVLEDMKMVLRDDPFAKFVLFSQHSSTLTAFKKMFADLNGYNSVDRFLGNADPLQTSTKFSCAVIDGHGSRKTDEELDRFRNNPECNICLLTTGVAATGLTLTMAYTCYILEPAYNAAEESQALSRVHRIGQSHRCVRCVIFYGLGTAEERLLALRKENGTIASHFNADDSGNGQSLEVEEDDRGHNISSTTRHALFTTDQLQKIFGVTNDRISQYRQW